MSDHTATVRAPELRRWPSIRPETVGVAGLLALTIAFFWFQNPQFMTQANALALLTNISVLGLVSLGQTAAIVGGGFDLSVGGTVALGAVVYVLMVNAGVPILMAFALATLGIGAVVGGINGTCVTVFRINPLITTLAMLAITGGVANSLANGLAISLDDTAAAFLASTPFLKIPVYVWLTAALYMVGTIVFRFTTFGRNIYVVGGNSEAARLAGIRVGATTTGLYLISACLAALAGCVTASQLLAASPSAGSTATLLSVTAVVLGGAALTGGNGGPAGTLLGVLVLGTLSQGMAISAVPTFYRDIITGVVLLLAVGASAWRTRARSR